MTTTTEPPATTTAQSLTLTDLVKRGESVYAANCAACHQANGKGAGPIKPLDGSAVVLDAEHAKQIQILLKGAANGAMPAWAQLSDTDKCLVDGADEQLQLLNLLSISQQVLHGRFD